MTMYYQPAFLQITRHKNVKSLKAYASLSIKQQAERSHVINKHIAGGNEGNSNNNMTHNQEGALSTPIRNIVPLSHSREIASFLPYNVEPLSPGLEAQLLSDFDLDPKPVVTTPSLNLPTILTVHQSICIFMVPELRVISS